MTNTQRIDIAKEQARLLREKGMGYKKISSITGLARETVRDACEKVQVGAENRELSDLIASGKACAFCGAVIERSGNMGRLRRFCSERCRRMYWKLHRAEQKRKPDKLFIRICAYCGKGFEVYGKSERKYCCREHYRLHFYGDDLDKSKA